MKQWTGETSNRWKRKRFDDLWGPDNVQLRTYTDILEDEDDTIELLYILLDDVPDEFIDQFNKWLGQGGYWSNVFQTKQVITKILKQNIDESYTWLATREENWENWYNWYIGETEKKPKPIRR